MKCARCNRPLNAPALTMKRNGADLWIGPKCARAMFPAKKAAQTVRRVAVEVDSRQMPLELEAVL